MGLTRSSTPLAAVLSFVWWDVQRVPSLNYSQPLSKNGLLKLGLKGLCYFQMTFFLVFYYKQGTKLRYFTPKLFGFKTFFGHFHFGSPKMQMNMMTIMIIPKKTQPNTCIPRQQKGSSSSLSSSTFFLVFLL